MSLPGTSASASFDAVGRSRATGSGAALGDDRRSDRLHSPIHGGRYSMSYFSIDNHIVVSRVTYNVWNFEKLFKWCY